jgi:rhodanese-related sulfurtransferase
MKAIQIVFAAVVTTLFTVAGAFAQAPTTLTPTPTKATGVEIVTLEAARDLLGKAAFFDMRSAVNFGKGHLKGAVALPYSGDSENSESFDASKDKFDVAKLPADKSALIVFYSDGPTGWKSYKAAMSTSRMGYKNIKWMRDGTAGWAAKGYPMVN